MSIIKENYQDGQQKIFDVNAKVLVPYSSIPVIKNKKLGRGTWVAGFPLWMIIPAV